MMSDSTNNNKVSGHIMSLQQLISAPLVATIDADAMSAERYMKHFMSLAFESYNPVDGSTGALRLISFNFTDSDASGRRGKEGQRAARQPGDAAAAANQAGGF